MNALVQLEPRALGEPLAPEIERARRYVAAAQAAATERAYRIGWNDFCAWCAFRRVEPLPAHPAAVAMYLSFLADRGLSAASIGQRAAAIAHRHRKAGHDAPTTNPVVQDALKGIRRTVGAAPRRKSAATADRIRQMLDACPHTMIGIRDRALLALGSQAPPGLAGGAAGRGSGRGADGYGDQRRRDRPGGGAEIVIPGGLFGSGPWRRCRRGYRPPVSRMAIYSVPFIEAATCGRGASPAMPWRRSSSSMPWRPGWIRQSSAVTRCAPGSSPARPRPAPQS
jgi:hypothetical protein